MARQLILKEAKLPEPSPFIEDSTLVTIYTDGACSGTNGGWGAVLSWRDVLRDLSGAEANTTNNRMELLAAISGLEALKRPSKVALYSDSKYVLDGITKWIHGWKRKGWKTSDGNDVKNVDLWQRLDEARKRHDVEWNWVRGHNGDPMNERADVLAVQSRKKLAEYN